MDFKDIWHRDYSGVDTDSGIEHQARMLFIEQMDAKEAVTFKRGYTITADVTTILDALYTIIPDARVVSPYERSTVVTGTFAAKPVFVEIYHSDGGGSPRPPGYGRQGAKARSKDIFEFTIKATGHRDVAWAVLNHLDKALATEHMALIKWWYRGDHGQPETRTVHLGALNTKIAPEFYPDLGDPEGYLRAYMESDEAVLMLEGPPGTGKTTLLRHLIVDHKLTAHVLYDEALMSSDSVFQAFLFDPHSDLLVIEDADTILSPREGADNKLMARFLNVSDGLIKLPNKKVVFTTNLNDFARVDAALLRPGRCFGVLHTRPLNLPEAQAAAKVAGVPVPVAKGEYTLADLFNQGRQQGTAGTVRRIGFSGR